MDYVRRIVKDKPKKKRGRPKKAKDFETTFGEHPDSELIKQRDEYKKQLDEMKARLDKLEGSTVKKEKFEPVDIKKIENTEILSATQRTQLEAEVKECERMLREKETLINASRSAAGGETSCFVRNDKTDKRIIFGKLIKAKRALHQGTVGNLSETDRQKLFKEKKRLEGILRDTFPSFNECNDPAKAVRLSGYLYKHNQTYYKEIKKLQNINKILEPDNPHAGNLRYLWKK